MGSSKVTVRVPGRTVSGDGCAGDRGGRGGLNDDGAAERSTCAADVGGLMIEVADLLRL
jgi:hypothetical protein